MKQATANAIAVGSVVKSIIMGVGALGLLAIGIYWATQGEWVKALIVWFIIQPIWFFVADIVTGALILPFVGLAGIVGRKEP